jgi:peptidoglycan/xylan/chitin deacetylase (PgdA/CDA1 family)
MERSAFLSVDVDSVASHLHGYGLPEAEPDGKAYDVAIPRILDLLNHHNAECTFFLIAREAARHPGAVRSIIEAGSEVACHSMTHPVPFAVSDKKTRQRELVDSKHVLEDISGRAVSGFRAPSWDVNNQLIAWLAEAGYLYDASAYPSWMLMLLRWSVARRSGSTASGLGLSVRQSVLGNPHPHIVDHGDSRFIEIPIATVPMLRIPYYHTLKAILPRPAFNLLTLLARLRRSSLGYVFHAVDFLEVAADTLDPRISRHPGMSVPLGDKLNAADEALSELSRRGRIRTLESVARELLVHAGRPVAGSVSC